MQASVHRSGTLIAILSAIALIIASCQGGGGATPRGGTPSASGGGGASASAPAPSDEPSASSGQTDEPSASGGGGGTVDLSGQSYTVGSKEFTEQLILGQITVQVLEAAGATVDSQVGLIGSDVVRGALESGDVDMYWEYTGTGWINHLGNTQPIIDAQEQYEAVRDADAANGIVWLDPAQFNNTYAIATSNENATALEVTTISDVAALAAENPENVTLCGASEFLNRDDGLPGLLEAYGFEFSRVDEVEFGLIFTSIDQASIDGDTCIFGEVFATDGRLAALGLTVLEDDKVFFGTYLPALTVRQDVFDANPELADLFAPITEALDEETMLGLNGQVDVDGEEPADVAAQFLTDNGFVGE